MISLAASCWTTNPYGVPEGIVMHSFGTLWLVCRIRTGWHALTQAHVPSLLARDFSGVSLHFPPGDWECQAATPNTRENDGKSLLLWTLGSQSLGNLFLMMKKS